MERSSLGLVLSLILHTILVWILVHAKAPDLSSQSETAEVTLIERDSRKPFVTEADIRPPNPLSDIKDKAEFLSQFTKRVKKQLRAREVGPTRNAAPVHRGDREGIAGRRARGDQREGFLAPGNGTPMPTVAIGNSSIAEYIPGVQEGAFTSLNTDQFTYYSFFARMNEQVRNRWVALVRRFMSQLTPRELEMLSRRERHTQIEIVLAPDGSIVKSEVHMSSGDLDLDQTSIGGFEHAAPFVNPPAGMIEEDGYIHLKYAFVVQFRPPTFGPDAE